MTSSILVRLGGLAAMVGGVVYAGVGLLEVHLGEELVYIGNIGYRFLVVSLPLGTMAAIVALYALHGERYGRAGMVLCLTAVLGLATATGALTLRVLATYPIYAFPDLGLFSVLIVLSLFVATAGMVLLLGRAGLPAGTRLYDLRHTCATLLLNSNVHPKYVQELLGHASIAQTLDTYSHMLKGMDSGIGDAMDAAVG